jgi:hypothetical protein
MFALAEYALIVLMCFAGIVGASPWLIFLGTLGLSVGGVAERLQALTRRPLLPFDGEIVTMFAAIVLEALCVCAAGYFLGVGMRTLFLGIKLLFGSG